MTLTPSVRAISRCSFPCVARSFACASFDAISTLECLFFLATAASLRPTNVIAHVRILLRRLNGPYKDLTRTLQGPYKGTRYSLAGSGARNRYVRKRTDWGLLKNPDRWQPLLRRTVNAQLTHS